MLEWTRDTCIDMLGIPCGSKSPIVILFVVDDESRKSAIIFYTSAPSLTLRDASGIKVDASLPLFWCT